MMLGLTEDVETISGQWRVNNSALHNIMIFNSYSGMKGKYPCRSSDPNGMPC